VSQHPEDLVHLVKLEGSTSLLALLPLQAHTVEKANKASTLVSTHEFKKSAAGMLACFGSHQYHYTTSTGPFRVYRSIFPGTT
jgi:hypothetical protein